MISRKALRSYYTDKIEFLPGRYIRVLSQHKKKELFKILRLLRNK